MRKSKYILICLALLAVSLPNAFCQEDQVDSLRQVLKKTSDDTSRLRLLVELAQISEMKDVMTYAQPAVELADKLLSNKPDRSLRSLLGTRKAAAVTVMGLVYEDEGDILKALDQFLRSAKILEEAGNKKGLASSFNDIGFIFEHQGDIPKAIDHYGRSLKIREEIGDTNGIAESLNNLGFIYKSQGDLPNALNYYQKSLKLYESIRLPNGQVGNKDGIGHVLNNIGQMYNRSGDHEEALNYFNRALKLHEESGDKEGIATLLGNIGTAYRNQGKLMEALDCFIRSLLIYKQIGQKKGIGIELNSVATVYLKQKKYPLALSYADSALVIAKELGFPSGIMTSEKLLSKIDSARGNFAGALEHYRQFIIYRDSLNNEETRKAGIKNQLKYEYDKKEAVMQETQAKERAVAEGRDRFQKIVIGSVAGGLLLVIVFAGFVYRSLKITHKQKEIIEEKQKEILDSIHYAKRIQTALMSNENYILKSLLRLRKIK